MRRIKDTKLCFCFERRGRSVLIPCHRKAEKGARFAFRSVVPLSGTERRTANEKFQSSRNTFCL